MKRIMPDGEPFFLPGNDIGVLLVHGFTGAPREMRWLAEKLTHQGYTTLGIRLAAHATRQADMIRARCTDWIASVEDGLHLLQGCTQHQVIVGLSMGGALALHAGACLPVRGVIALSTPFSSPDVRLEKLAPIMPFISLFWRYADKPAADWHEPSRATNHVEYPSYPVRATAEMVNLLRTMQKRLQDVLIPVLLIQSRADQSVPEQHAEKLFAELGSNDKHIHWLEKSGHVVTCDVEREQVFEQVYKFVQRIHSEEVKT